MLAESGEERGAMVGVDGKRCHQLRCILPQLCEWIKGWSHVGVRMGATAPTFRATGLVFLESAMAICAAPLFTPTTPHQTHSR